jgi:hypothetical protein
MEPPNHEAGTKPPLRFRSLSGGFVSTLGLLRLCLKNVPKVEMKDPKSLLEVTLPAGGEP